MAEKYQITREDSDEFGLQSQERAKAAVDGGYFEVTNYSFRNPKI